MKVLRRALLERSLRQHGVMTRDQAAVLLRTWAERPAKLWGEPIISEPGGAASYGFEEILMTNGPCGVGAERRILDYEQHLQCVSSLPFTLRGQLIDSYDQRSCVIIAEWSVGVLQRVALSSCPTLGEESLTLVVTWFASQGVRCVIHGMASQMAHDRAVRQHMAAQYGSYAIQAATRGELVLMHFSQVLPHVLLERALQAG